MSNDEALNGEVQAMEGNGPAVPLREDPLLLTMAGDTGTRLAYQVHNLVLVADILVIARRFFDRRGVEPAEQVRQLCEVSKGFDAIHATCVHVDKALRDGGAKWLDSVTAPCASGRARSVQIRLAMDRLGTEVIRLSFQVQCPQHYRSESLGAAAAAALELDDYLKEMLAILKSRVGQLSVLRWGPTREFSDPASTTGHAPGRSDADQAFGAALAFVEHLAMVAQDAREYRPHPDKPDAWQGVAYNFANAFIAWYDLTHLLTPAVCTEARRVYPPGASSIKLGASDEAAPVVPAMPASVVNGLAAYRRVKLGATPYPTVIEAVADELGVYFRNAVYTGRRHPLEPDLDRLIGEAKARATGRQVAQGKPAEPMGWGADLDELRAKETRAVVRERLGIKTYGDGQGLMMREWKGQDRARGETALLLLRCDPINFPEVRMQLIREAEAVIAAASKANDPTMNPAILARLEAVEAGLPAMLDLKLAGFKHAVGVIESLVARDDDDSLVTTLPELGPRDREAWQASLVQGMTQAKIAAVLNRKYPGENWTQPRVSEAITRAKAHAEASGLADQVSATRSRALARTVDPAAADWRQRTDGRSKHLREKARQIAKEE
jgi:hypothetical protein